MSHTARQRLSEILREESIQRGEFVLSSGRKSNYYLDCRRTTLHPEGAYLVGQLTLESIRDEGWTAQAIGGLTMGADPIATSTAVVSHLEGQPLPAFLVRKKRKEHATGNLIESAPPEGSSVVVVEDVVTSGGSALQAAEACREAGLQVVGVVAVVDREEGGREAIEEAGLPLVSLFRARDLLD